MPHRPGHNRFGSSTGTTGGPAGMGSPPPSQNFGSNVVIGGNPGDAGGSTSGPPRGPVGGPPPPSPPPPPNGGNGGSDGDGGGSTTTDDKTNIFTDPKTGKSGIDTFISNITGLGTDQGFQLPQFGFSGILQSLNSNNKFFDKLIEGNVTAKDRVTLVGLLKANADNPNVFDEALNQYADRNDLNAAEIIDLKNSLQSEVAGLERREEDFERLVEQYEAGRPQGFR